MQEIIEKNERYRVGRVYITATTPEKAEDIIAQLALSEKKGYICVSNMRTVVYANKNVEYCNLMNNAWMCLPDGTPLVWLAKMWGRKDVARTNGPDLFLSMLRKPSSEVKHFLLGDTEETLREIIKRYSDANIVGSYSPPFCELDEYDFIGIANKINNSGANIVWVSLRAPKQDFFSVRILPYLNGRICIGVGAAFRYAVGKIKHPKKFIQKMGLTGLFWRKNKLEALWNTFVRSLYLFRYCVEILFARLLKNE